MYLRGSKGNDLQVAKYYFNLYSLVFQIEPYGEVFFQQQYTKETF